MDFLVELEFLNMLEKYSGEISDRVFGLWIIRGHLHCHGYTFNIILITRLPSVWKTPVGYIITMADVMMGDAAAILCGIPSAFLCVGAGFLIKAIVKDITRDMCHLSAKKRVLRRNQPMLRIHFCEIVTLFTDVNELRNI